MAKKEKAMLQEIEDYVNNSRDIRPTVCYKSASFKSGRLVLDCQGWWELSMLYDGDDVTVTVGEGCCLGEPDINCISDIIYYKDKIVEILYREAA